MSLRTFFFCTIILTSIIPGLSVAGQDDGPKKARKLKVIPFPNIGYSPETNFYFGGVGLFTLRLYDDTITRTSNFKIESNYTLNKQFIAYTDYNIFFKQDRYYFFGENSFYKYPENFWGIGNNTSDSNEEKYDSKRLEIKMAFLRQVIDYLFAGPAYRLQYMYDIDTEAESLLNDSLINGASGGLSSGLGYVLMWDKRRNLLNPQQGHLIMFRNTFFEPAIFSDFEFVSYELDLRKYFPIAPKKFAEYRNPLIAVQLYNVFNTGAPPFRMLGLLGSDSHMRGYYLGRYRERQYSALQVEYRMPVWKWIGFALFTGAGEVANKIKDFRLDELKYNIGGGLRFRVDKQDNVNLRVDYAIGENGNSGFYIVFGESF